MIIDLLTLSGIVVALVVIGVIVALERHRFGCPTHPDTRHRHPAHPSD